MKKIQLLFPKIRPDVILKNHLSFSAQRIFLSALILFLGIMIFKTVYDSFKYTFLSYVSSPARAESKDSSPATFIYIPSVEIGLPIEQSRINFGMWSVTNDAASHLGTSALPQENGNIIIYAQNVNDQFGLLTSLHEGDPIYITTQDGATHSYSVSKLAVVSPLDVSLLSNSDNEMVTLYTSYGFGDLKRFVVQAKPISE